ncbi:hypothetical protein TRICI_002558 [Trichomonascus ciferrii]|uniref:Uncharacterized protein n=1 Tax=Trichomonascus ciferrii TaxID=44093 RepID=A0A642V673_9ASCO|nr:hypothetical protein TRICI_002558 [Trichomonascus ciferrii]
MAEEEGYDKDSAARELDPNRSGVSNQDVGWLARGNSLRSKDKGTRTRNRSTSLPTQHSPRSSISEPSLAPIKSGGSPRVPSPPPEEKKKLSDEYLENGVRCSQDDNGLISKPLSNKRPVILTNSPPMSSAEFPPATKATSGGSTVQRKPSWFQSLSSKFHHSDQQQQQQQQPQSAENAPTPAPPKLNTDNAISEGSCQSPGRRPSDTSTASVQRGGSLMTRLRRLSRTSTSNLAGSPTAVASPTASTSSVNRSSSEDKTDHRVVLNKNPTKKEYKVPELEGVLPKRVMFSEDVFKNDPPQQIPSRNPKKGNIEVSPNGEISRRSSNVCSLSPLNLSSSPTQTHYVLPKNYASTAHQASLTAHESAIRIANALRSGPGSGLGGGRLRDKFLPSSHSNASNDPLDEDTDDDEASATVQGNFDVKNVAEVDKPMTPKGGFDTTNKTEEEATSTTSANSSSTAVSRPHNLEDIYTRCCHLREILPIPATLKQVKGHKAPMDMIRLMNPKPTLIEILSFSDFLNIVPIQMIVLDNCSLSNEMLEILFSSIRNAPALFKLSLRNVIMEDEGWKYFCSFLCENQSLMTLDLSIQTDAKRCKLKPSANRSNVDWRLFTKALVSRGGIQELMLNGCMVPEAELDNMIMEACPRTRKLGLALNGLQCEDMDVLCRWISQPSTTCEGLDLGGNDLGSCVARITEFVSQSKDLMFLSLNSTNLRDCDEAEALLNELCKLPQLRYLDLSSNADLFPGFTKPLASKLPEFEDLRRIHLDSCNLSSDSTVQLAESFSLCPRLVYISLLNNREIEGTAAAALVMAVDMSSTIYTLEVDSDLIQPTVKKRLAHFCLVNMEHIIKGKLCKPRDGEKEADLDERELFESGNELAKAVGEILQGNNDPDDLNCSKVTDAMIRRARTIRQWVQNSLDKLLSRKGDKGGLDPQSKESLIRLIFLDGNLEKVLDMYDKSMEKRASTTDRSLVGQMHEKTKSLANGIGAATMDQADNTELQIAPIEENKTSISRRSSSASLQARAQEKEEGEVHKLGTFITKHRQHEDPEMDPDHAQQVLPSGEQLREAILAAKGSQSIHTLIEKVKQLHKPELEKILGEVETLGSKSSENASSDDPEQDSNEEVDEEVLDTVINDLTKVLSRQ